MGASSQLLWICTLHAVLEEMGGSEHSSFQICRTKSCFPDMTSQHSVVG